MLFFCFFVLFFIYLFLHLCLCFIFVFLFTFAFFWTRALHCSVFLCIFTGALHFFTPPEFLRRPLVQLPSSHPSSPTSPLAASPPSPVLRVLPPLDLAPHPHPPLPPPMAVAPSVAALSLRCSPAPSIPHYPSLYHLLPSPPKKNSDGPQQPNWENSARKPHKGASSVEKAMSPASSMAQSFWLFESERLRDPIWKRLFSNKGLGVCPGILPMASFLSLARPTHPTQLLLRCWGVVAQWVPRNACVTNCFRETFHHPMECKAFVTFVGSYHIRRNGEGTQTFFAISFFKLFSCCFFSAAAGQHLWWSKIWWNAQILFFET